MSSMEMEKLQKDFQSQYDLYTLERQDEDHCSAKGVRALAEAAKLQYKLAKASPDGQSLYHMGLCDDYKHMVLHYIEVAKKEAETPVIQNGAYQSPVQPARETAAQSKAQRTCPWLEMIRPTITFEDLVGDESNKKRLMEAISPDKDDQRIMDIYSYKPGRLFLLYGPTGSGKTALAQAAASKVLGDGGVFYKASCSTLLDKYVGETPKMIKQLFDQIRDETRPCVLLLDEIDALVPKRDGELRPYETQMITEFLQHIGSFTNPNALLIAATNRPWSIDEAIINRFAQTIYVDLPDAEARASAIQKKFANKLILADGLDIRAIADQLHHCSYRDLAKFDTEVRRLLYTRHKETGEMQVVTMEIVRQVRDQLSIIATDAYLQNFRDWANQHALGKQVLH